MIKENEKKDEVDSAQAIYWLDLLLLIAIEVNCLLDWWECLLIPADEVRSVVELVEMALVNELQRQVTVSDIFGLLPDLQDPLEQLAAFSTSC